VAARPARGPPEAPCYPPAAVITLAVTIHSLICVTLVFLILLHSGKDAGLSGAFGVGGSSGSYGGSTAIVERNLTRVTIAAALIFALTTFWLDRLL